MPIVDHTIAFGTLPGIEQQTITNIRNRNAAIAVKALGKEDYAFLGAVASAGFAGIRSAHGIMSLEIRPLNRTIVTRYGKPGFPSMSGEHMKVKYCWFSYAESAATGHAHGKIPTLIEFSGTGAGRIIFDYVRDLVIYTPDHYTTYQLVTENGAPLRTMG
ncbi:MAG TPA: hypothetical protein VF710_07520 [Longimicrobium sp.]|jgi:hypothetical protein